MFFRYILFFCFLSIVSVSAENTTPITSTKTDTGGFGRIKITSTPSNAHIIINGRKTIYTTPALLTNIKEGLNTIEISLPDYLFAKRQINVVADTTISISFELISLSDTAHIIGDLKLGILMLPQPPLNTPYLIDNKQIYSREVTLNTGKHHVVWEGGNRYSSLDTIVDIFPGKLTTFQFYPERLFGNLTISPFPYDADVYINNRFYNTGELNITLSTETYTVAVHRKGYYSKEQDVTINPKKHITLEIDLEEIPDRDHDGFLDSIDICPDTYGLYGGCPKQNRREAIRKYKDVLVKNFKEQPFVISVNTIGYLYRNPTNPNFREFISYFNDGNPFFNNRNGLIFANNYTFSFRGFLLSFELGQWYSGIKYKKNRHNPLIIKTLDKDSTINEYFIFYDTTANIKPCITFPSTALSGGFNLSIKKFNISYSLGYQWENIRISDLIIKEEFEKHYSDPTNKKYTGPRTEIVFNNDCWFNKLHVKFDLKKLKRTVPAFYASAAIFFGPNVKTGWHTFQTGIEYRFYPSSKRKKKRSIQNSGE
jgi:hypothetical protein